MASLERTPGKITIPGRPEAVAKSRISGQLGPIEYEFSGQENYIDSMAQGAQIKQALGNGNRVFLIRDHGIMHVAPQIPRPRELRATGTLVGFSVDDLENVLIPGKPVEIDINQAEGDTRSGIRFEVNQDDAWADKLEEADNIRSAFAEGARVFITEDDELLIVRPPFETK